MGLVNCEEFFLDFDQVMRFLSAYATFKKQHGAFRSAWMGGDNMISTTVLWFILALIVIGAEMFTGTVYLIAVAVACAAGGVASWLGLPESWQLAICALVTIIGAVLARSVRHRRQPEAEKLMHLDDGQRLLVETVAADGTATVQYRGAPWVASAETGVLTPGFWVIARVDGTRLILRPAS